MARQLDRDRPLAELNNTVPELLAVSVAQVSNFAAAHWPANALRSVVVGDLKAAGESLQKLDPRALVIEMSQLDLAAPGLVRASSSRVAFVVDPVQWMHGAHPDGEAKFWLLPQVAIATSTGLSTQQLRDAQLAVERHIEEIQNAWNHHFGS